MKGAKSDHMQWQRNPISVTEKKSVSEDRKISIHQFFSNLNGIQLMNDCNVYL